MGTRIEIFKDGSWEKLKLKDRKAIRYNKLINRIGKIESREIGHTNTFSIPFIHQNTKSLGINIFNKRGLAKAFNSKYPAKYYVEDKLLQQGFLVINNTRDGDININFIDEALEITEKWGSITYNDLLVSTSITKPSDYQIAIDEMTGYNMDKNSVLTSLSSVGTRGYNLSLFPNNLNAIGDVFQKDNNGNRIDDAFNPYQSRPVFNVLAFLDLITESFGYTPIYDNSVDWNKLKKTYFISDKLDSNSTGGLGTGVVDITYPAAGPTNWHYYLQNDIDDYESDIVFTYPIGEINTLKPSDVPLWTNPPGFNSGYENKTCIFVPGASNNTAGTIRWTGIIDPWQIGGEISIYSIWRSTLDGSVLFKELPKILNNSTNSTIDVSIDRTEFNSPPPNAGALIGVILQKKYYNVVDPFILFDEMQVTEGIVPQISSSYDEFGQYDANTVDLTHAAPRKTIKSLLASIMQKEGILMSIDGKFKTIKFFTYGAYGVNRDSGRFSNWTRFHQRHTKPLYNTDYGNSYARKNNIGLKKPFLGNEFILSLLNQGNDSKYKDQVNNYVKDLSDISKAESIQNTNVPYFEYTNKGLGIVESSTPLNGLTQQRADGSIQGNIINLQALANVNYSSLPSGVEEWYKLVDSAVRVESSFLLPIDVIKDLDLSEPIFIEGLGGFFIIEEVSEYVNARTPVKVKLIKLIESLGEDIVTGDIGIIGRYTGQSVYSALVNKLITGAEMGGSYSGSSIYSATVSKDITTKELVGAYNGSSSYSLVLTKPPILKDIGEAGYSSSSLYKGLLKIGGTVGVIPNLQQVTDRGNTTTKEITAPKFKVNGGLSSQFMKADGSLDDNIYIIYRNIEGGNPSSIYLPSQKIDGGTP